VDRRARYIVQGGTAPLGGKFPTLRKAPCPRPSEEACGPFGLRVSVVLTPGTGASVHSANLTRTVREIGQNELRQVGLAWVPHCGWSRRRLPRRCLAARYISDRNHSDLLILRRCRYCSWHGVRVTGDWIWFTPKEVGDDEEASLAPNIGGLRQLGRSGRPLGRTGRLAAIKDKGVDPCAKLPPPCRTWSPGKSHRSPSHWASGPVYHRQRTRGHRRWR